MHTRSPPTPLPLMLVHGWPGSFVEFLEVVPDLTDPPDGDDAFHVVVPSIPGFAWSGPTKERGWNARRIARAFVDQKAVLGYRRYGVHRRTVTVLGWQTRADACIRLRLADHRNEPSSVAT